MVKIALIDKSPSKTDYKKFFPFPFEVYHLCSKDQKKVLVKDIDISIDLKQYDFVVLIGSEALKYYSKNTSVNDYSGRKVISKKPNEYDNFVACLNPAALIFKPEQKDKFEQSVNMLLKLFMGQTTEQSLVEYKVAEEDESVLVKYLTNRLAEANILKASTYLSIDTETNSFSYKKGFIIGLCLSHAMNHGYYFGAMAVGQTALNLLQKLIDHPNVQIIGHNFKFDMHFLENSFGLVFDKAFEEGRAHDTMILHYVLDERTGTHGLKHLALNYTDMGDYDYELDCWKKEFCSSNKIKEDDFTYDLIPWDIISKYGCMDADATIRLFHKFYPLVQKNDKLFSLYNNILMPGLKFLTEMEERGVPINLKRVYKAKEILEDNIRKDYEKLYTFASVREFERVNGSVVNIASPIQLRSLLFDFEGLSSSKLTDSGLLSTDAEVLTALGEENPLANLILHIRKSTKTLSTYINKILMHTDPDGRLRTGFHLQTTTSGRLSSSGNLNLQQLPRDDAMVKGCIQAREGYKIIAVDMETAEMYIAAFLSGDKNLQQVFINMWQDPENSADFHSNIAHMVFKPNCVAKELKKLFPSLRQASKAISFGILFGSGKAKVAATVNEAMFEEHLEKGTPYNPISPEDAQEYINTYFARFPKLKQWIDSSHNQIKSAGYIYSYTGRKRRLHNIKSADRQVQGDELRSGFNAIIQGLSSDLLLLGTIEANKRIKKLGLDAKIICMVHDSVVAEVKDEDVAQYTELLIDCIKHVSGIQFQGCTMGVGIDSEDGGSADYSCGKLAKQYPELAEIGWC